MAPPLVRLSRLSKESRGTKIFFRVILSKAIGEVCALRIAKVLRVEDLDAKRERPRKIS